MNNDHKPKSNRLHSLDALRGFDMLWITGGDALIKALAVATGWPLFKATAEQMEHVPWEGFRFYDNIFPMFLFISGCTIPFSILKNKKTGISSGKIYRHLITRLIILFILGLIYNGFLQFDGSPRYASVLARIGLGWFFATIISMKFNIRGRAIWCVSLLIVYWLAMTLIPVPGFGAGVITLEGNLASYVDRLFLPGKLYFGVLDPEGILSTIPAISTALLGTLTGEFLLYDHKKLSGLKKSLVMLGSGFSLLVLGKIWGIFFPIIKNIWTSSFVLFAGGLSLIFLSIFYLIIDVWGYKKWSLFFIVFGMNSITIYLLNSGIIDFGGIAHYFFGGILKVFNDAWQQVVFNTGYIICAFLVLYLLYRNKIFLKI